MTPSSPVLASTLCSLSNFSRWLRCRLLSSVIWDFKKKFHLMINYDFLCSVFCVFWIFGRNNKQTNLLPPLIQLLLPLHCGFTNSYWCCGMRMSTFLWAVYQLGMLHKLHFSGCQLWGRISFVQLWRLRKSSTTFRCTLLQSSKYKEDFLCLLTPPQTFTGVAVNWSRISFVQECQCWQLDLFIFQLSLSLKLSLLPVWLRAPAEYPLHV